jgi:hypothetical protein
MLAISGPKNCVPPQNVVDFGRPCSPVSHVSLVLLLDTLGREKIWTPVVFSSFLRFSPIAFQNRVTFWLCIFGLLFAIWAKKWKILFVFSLYAALFLYFILQVGKVFSHHEYYIIPFVPAMAMMAGLGLNALVKHHWVFLGTLVFLAGFNIYQFFQREDEFFIPKTCQKFTKLEAIATRYTEPDAKVLVLTHPVFHPVMMYAAHKRGWVHPDFHVPRDLPWLAGEATVGLQYVLADRDNFKETLPYPVLFEDQDFIIYKIKK